MADKKSTDEISNIEEAWFKEMDSGPSPKEGAAAEAPAPVPVVVEPLSEPVPAPAALPVSAEKAPPERPAHVETRQFQAAYEPEKEKKAGVMHVQHSAHAAVDRAAGPVLPPPVFRTESQPQAPDQTIDWAAVAADLDREARAAGSGPEAAPLHMELGRLWEEKLGQPRYAAVSYQNAFNTDKAYGPNIAAAKRLFASHGNWEMLAQLASAEIGSLPPEAMGDALLRLGLTYLYRLNDLEKARAAFEKALEVGADFETLLCFEEVYLTAETAEKAATLFEGLAAAAGGEALRLEFVLIRARILEMALGDDGASLDAYKRAWTSDPQNDAAWSGYTRLLEKLGKWGELADVFSKNAEIIGGDGGARLCLHAARVYAGLGDQEKALAMHARAAFHAPGNALVLSRVAEAYEAAGKNAELVPVLEKLADLSADSKERASLRFRMGEILCNRLGREGDAAVQYRAALLENPAYIPAAAALGRIYRNGREFDRLVELYRAEAEQTCDGIQKVGKLFKAAEILEDDLHTDADAAALLSRILEIDPAYMPAIKSLSRIYGRTGRHSELVDVYEKEISLAFDKEQAVFLLEKIGWIREEKLGDPKGAESAYRRILDIMPNHLPTIRTLERICAALKDHEGLLRLLGREIDLCKDRNSAVPLLQRMGEIHEEELGDQDGAVVHYMKALEISPAYLPVLKALGRLFLRAGRHRELVEMYRREIGVTADREQVVSLLFRVGEIQMDNLAEPDAAVETFEKILAMAPDHLPALKALEKHFVRTGQREKLAGVFLRLEEVLADPVQKAIARFRAAETALYTAGDAERAAGMMERCLELVPGHQYFFAELEKLYIEGGRWSELAVLYMRGIEWGGGGPEAVRCNLALAEVLVSRLGDPAGAAGCYRRALEMDAGNLAAFQGLDMLLTRAGEVQQTAELLERWAAVTADVELKAALNLRLALLEEGRMNRPEAAASRYIAALGSAPANSASIEAMEMMYRKAGDAEGMMALLRHRISIEKDPGVLRDLHMRLVLMMSSAGAPLDDVIAGLRKAAGGELAFMPALLMLREALKKAEAWRDLVEVLGRITGLARDAKTAVRARTEAGAILEERLSDEEGAVNAYLEAFNLDPEDDALFSRLEANLERRAQWERLAGLYSKRAAVLRDGAAVFPLSMKAGEIYELRLGDHAAAAAQYAQAVSIDGGSVPALTSLARVQSAAGKWAEAAAYLEQAAARTQEHTVLKDIHRSLGVICHEHLADTVRASEHFQQVLAYDGREPTALEHLARIFMQKKAWPSAIQMLRMLVEGGGTREKQVQYLMALADVYFDGYGDDVQAGTLLRKALEMDYGNTDALDRLVRIYEISGDWHLLLATYDSFIAAVPSAEKLSAVPIMLKKGEVYASKQGNMEAAAGEYRKVLDVAPNNIQAMAALAQICGAAPATQGQAVELNRRLLHIDPFRQDSYRALMGVYQQKKDSDREACVFSALDFLQAASQEEKERYGAHRGGAAARGSGQITRDHWDEFVLNPKGAGLMRRVLKAVGGDLARVFPPPMDEYRIGRSDRLAPRSREPLRVFCDGLAHMISMPPEFEIYLSGRLGRFAEPENTETPSIIAGRDLPGIPFEEQRFEIGRALAYLRDFHMVAARLSPEDLSLLYHAAMNAADPSAPLPDADSAAIRETARRLSRAMPRKAKKALEDLVVEFSVTPRPDFASWKKGCELTACRTGLLLCGDLKAAMRCVWRRAHRDGEPPMGATLAELRDNLERSDAARDLLGYAVSEEYFNAREFLSQE